MQQRPNTLDQARRQRPRRYERLLYLPGAVVLVYGFWLSLTF